MHHPSDPPVIAIVVPLFAHSVLVADALESALEQSSRHPFVIIVVNDGCRYAESDATLKSIVAAHPGRIKYLVQPNSGLSAARNTGIEYALGRFGSLQAVYFLDADNAIQPKAIDNAYTELLGHPEAGWVYPNIDMFGIRRYYDYGGPYSLLKHTRHNICEAGSLVHRRVFDAGVRFDETMRLGYEDWDFWLSAAARGFRGVNCRHFGFLYRNRAESMLSQSRRDDAEIAAYMQRKHRRLLEPRNLARLEAVEAPRHAFVFTDTEEVLIATGTAENAASLSPAAFDEMLWRNLVIPNWQHMPPLIVFTTRAMHDELLRAGLLLWMLYDCERALETMNLYCLDLVREGDSTYALSPGRKIRDCGVLAVRRDLLCSVIMDADSNWIESVQMPGPDMKVQHRTLTIPQRSEAAGPAQGGAVFAFLLKILAWRASPYRPSALQRWIWRGVSVPPSHALLNVVREAFAGEVVFPAISNTGRNIGFVMSVGSFGGVERVAYNVARQFVHAGWRIHLFMLGCDRFELPAEFAGIAASVNFLEGPEYGSWDAASSYQGTALPAIGRDAPKGVNRIVAALGWLDAVVNCHSGPLNAAAAALRRLGVKTLSHQHLLDHSALGRSVGHSLLALAYEHAYDMVVCNSAQHMSWMHAAGVPREKLLHVPNAPGHAIDAATRERYRARRLRDTGELNVLYLGRLDRQKGLDRLASLIKNVEQSALPVHWRIVGGAVAGDYDIPAILGKYLEPAVYDRDGLIALFEWADVMVLLSDYEGLPLSVLEARRAGVVVVATDVGALSEVIETGVNGFLVACETAVQETLRILGMLAESAAMRANIADAAMNVLEWPEAAAELVRRVTELVPVRAA